MPTMSGNLTALRSSHTAQVYVSLLTGDPVLTGTVSADADETSALNIAYTLSTGDAADVLPGYRVMIYDSTGYFKGMTSIRYAGTISSTNLPIRELSSGEIIVVSTDTFTVYDDVVLTDKLPAASTGFEPDSTTYSDQNSNPAPIATSGGNWAGWLTSAGTVAVPFDGSASYTVDPDSAGTITHAWSCASGTWDDATSATPTLTLSATGKYTVFHTVTDSSNSKTDTQVIRIRVHDQNDPPYECILSNNSGDPSGGFGVTFSLFANADLVTIPDLAPVLVWQDQTLAGAPASYGAKVASRSHVVLNGFFRRDRGRGSGDTGLEEIEFEVINPLARLGELPNFSKAIVRNQSPTDWQSIKTLTVKRAIIHLLRNYTNIAQICDLVFDGFPDANYPASYVQRQSTLEQARELADSRGGRIICDRTGRIEVQLRIEFTPLVSRTSLDTTISLSQLDIIDYELSRDHAGTVETYRARGFTAATDEASATTLFARFPASPARGPQAYTIDKLICDDQADLFNQCALRAAWENAVYYEAGGIHHRAPEVRLTLFGGYAHLFQFYRELVYVMLLTNLRGITTLTYRFIPQSVSVDYADGTATTTLVMRAETHASGAYAVDDTPAAESYAPTDPGITFPSILTTDPTRTLDGLTALPVDLAAMNADGNLYVISNGSTLRYGQPPTATPYNLSLTGTPQDFVVRADSPKYVGSGTTVNAHILTSTRYYSIADLAGARTLSNTTTLSGSSSLKTMQFERGDPDWGIITWYTYLGGVYIRYTTDGGVTWSAETIINANYETTPTGSIPPGLWLDPSGSGTAYVSVYTNTSAGAAVTTAIYRTTDYGANWALYSLNSIDPGDLLAAGIVRGVNDTSNFYTTRSNGAISGYDPRLYRNTTDISPSISGNYYAMNTYNRSFSVADDDANTGVLCGLADYSGSGARAVFRTHTLRATTPTWTQLSATDITNARRVYAVNRNVYYFVGASGYLAYVGDASTVNEGAISGAGEFVGLCGL